MLRFKYAISELADLNTYDLHEFKLNAGNDLGVGIIGKIDTLSPDVLIAFFAFKFKRDVIAVYHYGVQNPVA